MSSFFIVFISIFFLIGFGVFGWGLLSLYRGHSAKAWPTTRGEILESRIHESRDSDGSMWETKVKYRYVCNGREFEGTRITFGYSGSDEEEEHRRIHEKLPPGSGVRVWYQPNQPANAVLAVGFHRHTYVALLFGAVWLLFTAGFTALVASDSMSWGRIEAKIQPVD